MFFRCHLDFPYSRPRARIYIAIASLWLLSYGADSHFIIDVYCLIRQHNTNSIVDNGLPYKSNCSCALRRIKELLLNRAHIQRIVAHSTVQHVLHRLFYWFVCSTYMGGIYPAECELLSAAVHTTPMQCDLVGILMLYAVESWAKRCT